jgi:hypothetical protein
MLNGRELDPRDFVNWFDVTEPSLLTRILPYFSGETILAISALCRFDGPRQLLKGVTPLFAGAIKAVRAAGLGNGNSSTIELAALIAGHRLPPSLRIQLVLFLISILIERGEIGAGADLVAQEFVNHPSVQRALPIAELMGADGWRSLRPYSQQLSVPIVLALRWRETNDDKIATYRRFATNQFLAKNCFQRPSDMRSRFSEFPREELVCFLDKICVSSVLDMLPVFKSIVGIRALE